jgi:hypothetical protein
VPFDITAFATAAYLGLTESARTLFESCILLGGFADLHRVQEVAALDGQQLLAALRTLEDLGLLSFAQGELRCAHALLAEASRELIPNSVAAALHERIATRLEREAAEDNYADSLSAAAAEHWLAAGDVAAASRLLQRCAAQAAALGEPRLAAAMLLDLPRSALLAADRIALVQAIVTYADVAGSSDMLLASLRDLLRVSKSHGGSPQTLRELDFRIIETELDLGARPNTSIGSLSRHLGDAEASIPIRVRAGIRLLIAADMNLDSQLADNTLASLRPVLEQLGATDPLRVRAQLIYETLFGDSLRARELANALLVSHPASTLHRATARARRDAASCYTRLGLRSLANPVLLEEYRCMVSHHLTREATYSVLLLADDDLCDGNIGRASHWITEAKALIDADPGGESHQASYYSCAAYLAIIERRFDDAERLINTAHERCPTVGLPRYRAFALAIRLKAALLRGDSPLPHEEFRELRELYDRGAHLGGQDPVVETLWLYEATQGRARTGSSILRDYLGQHRRELGPPEVSLRTTSAADGAWSRQPT